MEERRMRTDDQPESLVHEKFMATAYQVHPYMHPVIGWMADLEKLTVKDVRDWYQRWYVPNNATLVVVGDVVPREVFALARQYFGPIPSRPLPRSRPAAEPPQTEMRQAEVSRHIRRRRQRALQPAINSRTTDRDRRGQRLQPRRALPGDIHHQRDTGTRPQSGGTKGGYSGATRTHQTRAGHA